MSAADIRAGLDTLQIHDRPALTGLDSNLLSSRLDDVIKYFDFVLLTADEMEPARARFVEISRARQKLAASFGEGTHSITPEELELMSQSHMAQTRLTLKVEALILFATICLDRAASFTPAYLGAARKPWNSFDSFKFFERYASNRGFPPPSAELRGEITWLTSTVVGFRHELLVHRQEGDDRIRYSLGVSYGIATGEISYGHSGTLYPIDKDEFRPQFAPAAVVEHVDRFLVLWLQYLDATVPPAP